jgi:hypothetical protein
LLTTSSEPAQSSMRALIAYPGGRTRTVTPSVRAELWRRREAFAARLRQSALKVTGVFTLFTTKRRDPTTAPDESHSVDEFAVIRRRRRPGLVAAKHPMSARRG